ncbi:MAG: alpha/beta hydrolase [Ruminococcaceae bacterium]|nr:alpha/beta hydrolase [Oscillospiraceae bacterium]
METRKRIIPCDKKGEEVKGEKEREYIFFKVQFNSFRDVGNSTENEVRDKEEMNECECVLALPESYTDDGQPTQLILACHGAGSNVMEAKNQVGGLIPVAKSIDAGYAALDISGSRWHGLTMGCPEHLFALYKAYKYAINHYNLTTSVLLAGGSMGGQTALNFAAMFPSIVLAAGIFFPRLNIDGVDVDGHYCRGTWDKTEKKGDSPSTRERIIDVFRFPDSEWCDRNTVGSNSYRLRSYVGADGKRVVIPPCPIKIWQGTADKVTDPVMAVEFINSIWRSGSYAEIHLLDGVGHNVTEVMKEEQVIWFNRFK